MKYRIFFIIAVLWPVALLEAGYPPLTIYYNFGDEKYVLTNPEDTKDTEQLADWLPPEIPRRPKVVYCCPAETSEQKNIRDEDTTFQALFVKMKKNPEDPTQKIECTDEYKTSMRKKSNDEVLIGYAIHEFINNDVDWPTRNTKEKNFIWVFEKQIKYSFAWRGAVRSIHYIFPKQYTSEGECPNYDLGIDILDFTKEDIERFYSVKNQDEAFENMQRPIVESYLKDVETNGFRFIRKKHRKETVVKNAYENVVMHQLIPIADFSEIHLRMETCSYLNIIPVWNSIHKGSLTKVEKYIRGIADKLPANNSLRNKLKVRTIPQKEISGTKYRTVYLDRKNNKYPVYRMIIKIISYLYSPFESNQPQESQQESLPELQQKPKEKHLHIAIVIHNELNSPESTLCKVNVCGQLGWHVASMEGGLTYCCLLNDLPELVKSEHLHVDHIPFNLNEILPKGVHPFPPPVGEAGTNPAIIVLYYPQEGTYRYVDFKQPQELHLPSDAESQFTDILLYCPPETIDQEVSASILKVDLTFVRKIVKTVEDIGDPNICVNRYKPAVWCGSFNTYHVGYLVSEHEASMKTQRIYSSPEKQQKEYRGVTLFWIHYSTYEVRPGHSEHVMTSKKQSPGIDDLCENNMKMGLHMIGLPESTFIDAYSKKNQNEYQNYEYDSSKYYFVKKLLVPSDDFDDYGRKLATCSYMNTYPVWNIVNHALLGVENYLRKILGKLESVDEFFIHTRLIDTLLLPVRSPRDSPMATNQDKENSPDPGLEAVHLSPSQSKIPVPARIVKIIGHRVPLPQKQDQGSNYIQYKYYFMAIVFENKIEKELNRWEKCKQVVDCIDYGWDMKEWEWAGNRPYCCGLEVIPYGEKEDKLPFTAQEGQYEIFDLENVVIELGEQNVTQDIASSVNHQPIGLEQGSG